MENRHKTFPTPYPDLDRVLWDFVDRVQAVLSTNFVGAYLQGSFAVGDFDLHSDVDFLMVIEEELSHEEVHGLQAVHEHIYGLDIPWAQHLEGSYPYDFTVAGGTDLGNAIGTNNGIRRDRELLFLGSPANHAAKIIGAANSFHLTHNIYNALPNDLQELCVRAGQDLYGQNLYQLGQVTKAKLDKLLTFYSIPWKRDMTAQYVEDEKRRYPLVKILYGSANSEINLDKLSIGNNKLVLAVSIFADVSGFTRYIDAAKSKRDKQTALRVFHAIRQSHL